MLLLSSVTLVAPVAAQDPCQVTVSSQQELTNAITNASTACSAGATITLNNNIETTSGTITDSYNAGNNAFPVIGSIITIDGNGYAIVRNKTSGNYRFFSVGANGNLTLKNVTLQDGGLINKGGAILVYSMGGNATLHVIDSTLRNNVASNDAGAIQIASVKDFSITVTIENSQLYDNAAGPNNAAEGEGGAIYSDGRAGGVLQLILTGTNVSNNVAGRSAGAINFNTGGQSTVTLTVDNSNFSNNTTPQCAFNGTVTVGGTNRATDSTCGQAVIVPPCTFTPASTQDLTDAINKANDEVACPGPDTITLAADLNLATSHDGGDTAFPTIVTTIEIVGADHSITRDTSAPVFRFFLVDGKNGNKGDLTLSNMSLNSGGGQGVSGGAVLADGSTGGQVTVSVNTVIFNDNQGDNGGAIAIISFGGGRGSAFITNSDFNRNVGLYGGAFYSGAFDAGNNSVFISASRFMGNAASIEGGAVYNNGLAATSTAILSIDGSNFDTNSSAGAGGAILNNGRSAGNAELALRATTFIRNSATGAGDTVFNYGFEGNATISLSEGNSVGGAENVCLGDDNETLEVIPCP